MSEQKSSYLLAILSMIELGGLTAYIFNWFNINYLLATLQKSINYLLKIIY